MYGLGLTLLDDNDYDDDDDYDYPQQDLGLTTTDKTEGLLIIRIESVQVESLGLMFADDDAKVVGETTIKIKIPDHLHQPSSNFEIMRYTLLSADMN